MENQNTNMISNHMKSFMNYIKNPINIIKHTIFKQGNRTHNKIYALFISVFVFAFIYLILPDGNFSGVNIVKETIKQEIIKKKVAKNIDEKVTEPFVSFSNEPTYNTFENEQKVKAKLDEATDIVKKDVEKDTITPDKIETSVVQKIFDRLYFSVQNATLLGYGDIYPVSNLCKTVVIFQSLLTITLILY